MSPRPTRRVKRGSGHGYYLDNEVVSGVTTILNRGYPKPALVGWAARTTAEWCADHPIGVRDRDGYVAEAKKAPDRDRDGAARRGTQVHELADTIAAGGEVEVPDLLVGHVDQYLRFLDQFDPTFVAREASVFSRRSRYAGTFDFVASIPALETDGNVLVDVKTNRTGPFGEVALQLAAYRYADIWLDGDLERPIADLAIASTAVLWITSDAYELRPVDTNLDVWRAFRYVQQVAELELDELLGEPVPAPAKATT